MKIIGGILVFSAVLGGLSFFGIVGSPSSPLDARETHYLESLPLEPIQQSMGVAQAYRAIPHKQVTFRSSKSVLNSEEAKYLERAFSLVDLAVVERMVLLRSIKRKTNRPLRLDNYEQILKRFLALPVPTGLDYFHKQVVASIVEEQDYFQGLQEQPSATVVDLAHPLIQGSHRRLVASYQFLLSQYPDESQINQQAFYEHLCALDFI